MRLKKLLKRIQGVHIIVTLISLRAESELLLILDPLSRLREYLLGPGSSGVQHLPNLVKAVLKHLALFPIPLIIP